MMYRMLQILICLFVFIFFAGCTKAPDQESQVIKIGTILPLTGNIAFIGESFKNGLDLALSEAGAKSIKIIHENSKAQPKEAVNITNKLLMDDDVKLLITNLSSVTNAVIPIVTDHKPPLLLLASLTSLSGVTNNSQYVFRYFLPSIDEVNKMLSYFQDNNINQLGVIYINDTFGKDAVNLLMAEYGKAIVLKESFSPRQIDFKDIIAKFKDLSNIYIIGYGPTYGNLIEQLREYGYKGNLYGFSGIASPSVLNKAGQAAEGIIFTGTSFNPQNPITNIEKEFVKTYEEHFNKLPDHYAGYGYDIGMIITKVISSSNMSTKNIKDSLLALSLFDGVIGHSSIDQSGDFHFDVKLYVVDTARNIRPLKE